MAWKRQRTSRSIDVDVELSDFDPEQLLQGLINAGLLTEVEAVAIAARGGFKKTGENVLSDEMQAARDEIYRGRRTEALIHLERALGHEWIGRLVQ